MKARELDSDLDFIIPQEPEASRESNGRNNKAIGYIKTSIQVPRIAFRGSNLRNEGYLRPGGIHQLG
jgi:hypothetical protein